MSEEILITGNNEEEVWQQVAADLNKEDIFEYRALIEQAGKQILLDIDIDLGGGFEGGYATTTLTAPLLAVQNFRFAIHKQHFIDKAGKLLGMEDVVIGYPDFDKKFIIKTNDAVKTKIIFADSTLRQDLQNLDEFTLQILEKDISDTEEKQVVLQLDMEEGITDPKVLRSIYHAYYTVLSIIDRVESNSSL